MPASSLQAQGKEATASVPLPLADRRRHRRFPVVLFGRFMRENKHEYPCKLMDISVGGAAIASPVAPDIGERIIAYFDQIGGIEARVERVFEGGFAAAFVATQHKREKLAAQITWLISRDDLGERPERRFERSAARDQSTTLRVGEGAPQPCKIIDFSLSGASVATSVRPDVGTELVLGKLRARVVRHHEVGLAVEFLEPQDAEVLRRQFE